MRYVRRRKLVGLTDEAAGKLVVEEGKLVNFGRCWVELLQVKASVDYARGNTETLLVQPLLMTCEALSSLGVRRAYG